MSSLERFKRAQADAVTGFEAAMSELRAGEKKSHWIWYIFPQLAGLGRSSTAQFYGLRDLGEAIDYLRDSVLAGRLGRAMDVVADQVERGVKLETLMGGWTDALKLVSCLTLFEVAARRMEGEDVAGERARMTEAIRRSLAVAEREGLRRCAFTLSACARGAES